jgi:hypothetical protein
MSKRNVYFVAKPWNGKYLFGKLYCSSKTKLPGSQQESALATQTKRTAYGYEK